MSGAVYAIEVDVGATFRLGLIPSTEVDAVRTPYDLTDATFAMRVRNLKTGGMTDLSSRITVDDDDIIRLHLSAEDTASFAPHSGHHYVIDMTLAGGDTRRLLQGPLHLRSYNVVV